MNYLFQYNQFSRYATPKYQMQIENGKLFKGLTHKTEQDLKDTKDKFDKPTGVMIVNARKTQRNNECPCGSKKKFKHCHLA